jgi:thiol-disulfide isomerase/thioredoxin
MNISQEPQIMKQAYNEGKEVFVLVYMDGCPYCDPIIPIWNQIDSDIQKNPMYNSQIKITKIERSNLDKVDKYIKGVESFPTFLHLGQGLNTSKHDPGRTPKMLLDWIKKTSQARSCPCSRSKSCACLRSKTCICPPSCPCIRSHSKSCSCPPSCRCYRSHKKNTKGGTKTSCPCSRSASCACIRAQTCSCPPSCPCVRSHSGSCPCIRAQTCSCPPSCSCVRSHSKSCSCTRSCSCFRSRSCSCPSSCRCIRSHKKNTKGRIKRSGIKKTRKNNKKK